MEVKIKNGNKMLDATIEMIDGVMVVSPKKEKFVPKDGDVIVSGGDVRYVAIFKAMKNEYSFYYYALLVLREETKPLLNNWAGFMNTRPATEEEKNLLFDELSEKGFEWDVEKRELVQVKWTPKVGEICFAPYFDFPKFITKQWLWEINGFSTDCYNKNWVFRTERECQEFSDKLNQAIEGVKP